MNANAPVARTCPRIVIAGTGSGVGKTSLTLGIVGALVRRGLRVQTFKVGPDFLDPGYLAMASGRPCYNLDGWMSGDDSRRYVAELFARTTHDADIAIIEGVMGLFDGASADALEGSTAEIAAWLQAPVLLVVNAHGAARSLAATVKGFATFEPDVRIAGIIANHAGSDRHRAWIDASLTAAGLPRLVGAVPRESLPPLQSRHLGLMTADHGGLSTETLAELADRCTRYLDLDAIQNLAAAAPALASPPSLAVGSERKLRLGLAQDAAFHFYYADTLEMMTRLGVTWVPFSPLTCRQLPTDLDGLYLGGGYPELHAEALAANTTLLDDLRHFADSGRPIYAECGGLMYLARSIETQSKRVPMLGVLPLDTQMLPKLSTLGYSEVTFAHDCLWGAAGTTLRGHEYHYSKITRDDTASRGWQRVYSIRRRRSAEQPTEGFQKGRILASYVHLHLASRPDALHSFLKLCEASR